MHVVGPNNEPANNLEWIGPVMIIGPNKILKLVNYLSPLNLHNNKDMQK